MGKEDLNQYVGETDLALEFFKKGDDNSPDIFVVINFADLSDECFIYGRIANGRYTLARDKNETLKNIDTQKNLYGADNTFIYLIPSGAGINFIEKAKIAILEKCGGDINQADWLSCSLNYLKKKMVN